MREFVLLFVGILMLASCASESIVSEDIVTASVVAGKIGVCHNGGNEIVISENALQTHIDHGDAMDRDGDGFYDAENPCSETDCDDTPGSGASVYPGATEICDNGIDDNCDGNVDENCIIPTVTISNQVWMQKNLDVATYRDGTIIPEAKTNEEWIAAGIAKTGAWCYYENSTANGTTYGKLYNWYAVNDIRGLAPEGWHIPSEVEWATLYTFLLGIHIDNEHISQAMRSTTSWVSSPDGSNLSGFSALASGARVNGEFQNLGERTRWWSSTVSTIIDSSRIWGLFPDLSPEIRLASSSNPNGYSIRCVKN